MLNETEVVERKQLSKARSLTLTFEPGDPKHPVTLEGKETEVFKAKTTITMTFGLLTPKTTLVFYLKRTIILRSLKSVGPILSY